MSSIRAFFRHCPSCGRRFEIRLLSKGPVALETETVAADAGEDRVGASTPPRVMDTQSPPSYHLLSHDSSPLTVLEEEFLYSYMCKHCGHTWSEERFKFEAEKVEPSYKGD